MIWMPRWAYVQIGRAVNYQGPCTVSQLTSTYLHVFSDNNSLDGGEDLESIIVGAFQKYVISNPLHPDAFPAVRKMEAEVVQMCLRMYNNPDGAGTMTSGGTESIIMSVKTHRDWAKAVKGITEPEM